MAQIPDGIRSAQAACHVRGQGLKDVLAVQALSRLNRSANRLAKKKEDVLSDFFNDENIIKQSFDKFYTSTSLMGETDVNILHDLKETLDESGLLQDKFRICGGLFPER